MTDYRQAMKTYIEQELAVLQALNLDELNEAANAIMETWKRGGVIYTMGNGGSAATASHMVCDFGKGLSDLLGGKPVRVQCLCDSTPMVMAVANDLCYEDVFLYQLQGRLRPEDLVIAISGSGNSENVVRAVKYAREIGTPVVALTGYNGGKLAGLADFQMHVTVDDMQIAEDVHMMFDHMLLRVLGSVNRDV